MAAKPADFESLLDCCICLGECRDPRLLPCAHSLCRQCLEDHIKSSAHEGRYQCPACRHLCEVPAEGAAGVPKNFFLNKLREILQRQTGDHEQAARTTADVTSTAEVPGCSNKNADTIKHTSVTVFCVECAKYLCSNCENFHKMFGNESHELQPAETTAATEGQGLKIRRQNPKCDNHVALQKDMYCDTCRVLMCVKCCLLEHQQHRYRELDALTDESAANLSELTKIAEERSDLLGSHLAALDVIQETMDADAKKAYAEICQAADELRDLVTKKEHALIKEIKDFHAVAAAELKAAYKETELNKASIQSLLSYINALQASGDVSDQVVHTPGLQEQLRLQARLPLKSVSWTVNFRSNIEGTNALLESELTVISRVSRCNYGDKKRIDMLSSLKTLKPPGHSFTGITKIGDCVCVVGHCQQFLWLHNLGSNSSREHTLRDLEAVGITNVGQKSNTLVITDRNKKLHFITIDPQTMDITNQLTRDIQFEPNRIKYDSNTERLIIANKTDKQIVLCSKTGFIERRITVEAKLDEILCALPAADESYIVLENAMRGSLFWVNKYGQLTNSLSSTSRGESFQYPRDAVQDIQGRLLVACLHNHAVRLIINKHFSHNVISKVFPGKLSPMGLYLDEMAGTLFVGYGPRGEEVIMYKWPYPLASPAFTETVTKQFDLDVKLGRYK